MVWSPTLFTSTIFFFQFLSTTISTSFLDLTLSVYQSLNLKLYISNDSIHCIHRVSYKSKYISCYKMKLTLMTNFFTHIYSWKCGNQSLFFTTFSWWYDDPYSFNNILKLYHALFLVNDLIFTLLHISSIVI